MSQALDAGVNALAGELAALLARQLEHLAERAPRSHALLQQDALLAAQAARVLVASDFVCRSLIQDDALLSETMAAGGFAEPRTEQVYRQLLAACAQDADEALFGVRLRRLRRREMVRIAWRDLAGLATTEQILRELSQFAACTIDAAVMFAAQRLATRHGMPQGEDAGLVVLGMGKLGGGELNFSSDVDLIFLYESGEDTPGPAPLSREEFYLRQARLAIRLLDTVTEDGFVFRVDMRLRPFGDSGPLVASFAFFEDYLQLHGRDWERYAYVKARAISGAAAFEPLRENVLRPFVFRRYLDFGVFESLREMKALIQREVARREMADNIKLGAGGIREVEFIVQAFQLVRGGQNPLMRDPSLLTVLPLLGRRRLPPAVVAELMSAYDFLRRLENRIQMLDDAQTHSLPSDPLQRARMALAMGLPDVATLEAQLAVHRAVVARHFADLFSVSAAAPAGCAKLDLAPLWEPELDREGLLDRLREARCADADALLGLLEQVRGSARLRRLDETGRRRLKALLELLVVEQPAGCGLDPLRRLCAILEAIGQRSAYFSLLMENRAARERLFAVCASGEFLAAQLVRNPGLLDELLGGGWLQSLPSRPALERELAVRLADVQPDDPEREVEILCRFKQAAVFRVAVADLIGGLPLMQVSDRLTEIAEVIVQYALDAAWRQMTAQLGTPFCVEAGAARPVRVAALAYGKLAGWELGYGSDLDIVFLHDSVGEQQETDRASPVDNQIFFLRFGQRVLHLLTVHSAAGRLYEVDVRLRPSGKGGLMVTSIEAFRRYQFEEAWTWEHQALLHARAVAGDAGLMQRIGQTRLEVLRKAVRRDRLQEDVLQMRERMRRELSGAKPGRFDMKQDRGGMADIEFLAQYWALRWADEAPPVAWYPDTIRQLESVASADLVPQHTVDVLVAAYQRYRQHGHHLSLEGRDNIVPAEDFFTEREQVAAIWRQTMGGL
ncbi:MAG: bifunctional [glutamate--ammonia ligase]-adenylyl-L-tyrosine phosphorylase/[glutamate--ammonia-ligase] adenylyltransferase [Steroidobacteraceae bacterium]